MYEGWWRYNGGDERLAGGWRFDYRLDEFLFQQCETRYLMSNTHKSNALYAIINGLTILLKKGFNEWIQLKH
ncbi:hypothetical protein HUZ95_01995 [Cronobacter turicensis]|uniref:hypothetical protein n=1 Tax=Cronobacter turicensis TaxID=413502 RepID=UPI001588066A|nr:hypothetical protein [Cronobacter turicensis]NUW53994.1 hypothetical protein [Cronobacter turicensis]